MRQAVALGGLFCVHHLMIRMYKLRSYLFPRLGNIFLWENIARTLPVLPFVLSEFGPQARFVLYDMQLVLY